MVLENEGSNVLVISKYALDMKPYDTERPNVNWESCDLRGWLNGEFYNEAFSEKERRQIVETLVSAEDKYHSADLDFYHFLGNDTRDNVFLLGIDELQKYLEYNISLETKKEKITCYPTEYAVAQGVVTWGDQEGCHWWLRSPSKLGYGVMIGWGYAYSLTGEKATLDRNGVRPALWINLDS